MMMRCFGKGVKVDRFLVREAYTVLKPFTPMIFLVRGIQVLRAPTKSTFDSWEASWGKFLTLNKLQRRGWHLHNRCFLCGSNEETIHH